MGAWTGGAGKSETDLARSWIGAAVRGGEPPAIEKEGRCPPVMLLSARDLSCSDQLKPCWSRRDGLSEGFLGCVVLLACGKEEAGMPMLARRPAMAAEMLGPCIWAMDPRLLLGLRVGWGGGEVGLLPLPGLPPPGRYPLIAEPPKLMRRVKGVFGAVLATMSSSSMALSSMESELLELVDMLPRRIPRADAPLDEAPDRPRVVTERRRR